MQPVARHDMIHIGHVKIHAQVDRISDKPQIHLEHTAVMSFLIQKDGRVASF